LPGLLAPFRALQLHLAPVSICWRDPPFESDFPNPSIVCSLVFVLLTLLTVSLNLFSLFRVVLSSLQRALSSLLTSEIEWRSDRHLPRREVLPPKLDGSRLHEHPLTTPTNLQRRTFASTSEHSRDALFLGYPRRFGHFFPAPNSPRYEPFPVPQKGID